MLWLIIFNCCIYLFTSATALRCALENSVVKEPAVENCSPLITDCFQFRCEGSDKETHERGCNDNFSTLWNCQVLGAACVQAGGKAYCDTCANDMCNNAVTASFPSIITITIFSVLFALSVAI